MIIAIPSEGPEGLLAMRSGHFGHCAYFTLVEVEDGKIGSVKAVKNVDHDTYGCGGVIDFALSLGIDVMLAAGMGRPPFMRFTQSGVEVYIEQTQPTVQGALQVYLAGNAPLMSEDQACVH